MVLGSLAEVTVAGDDLNAPFAGTELALVPVARDRFAREKRMLFGLLRFRLPKMDVEFKDVEGRSFAILGGQPVPLAFERATPGPIPAAWLWRVGSYTAERTDDQLIVFHAMRLVVERGLLVAHITSSVPAFGGSRGENTVALRAVSDDEAVVVGEGGTLRALPGQGATVLRYAGFRFHAVGAR